MSTSPEEQILTVQENFPTIDISDPKHLHSKLNAEISKQIDALEEEIYHEERFQIDRTKLEKMMMAFDDDGKTNADLYFEQIMNSTQTEIEWLPSLKWDANNIKKHPFIRVWGRRMEDVTWAKGLILASLEVSNAVFRLKMSIANADHYFIMGRNNNNINRIMDHTQTHIQFPDPNLVKKGNQVTLHGTLEDLENARGLLRLSSPIVMSFELPMNQPIPSSERIGNYFKVQVMFASSPKPNTLLVLIRGSTRRVDKVKKASRSLLGYALGKMANFTIVSVQLEVPPQHQESVKGENCENIIAIMEHTNTKIFFPDLTIRGSRRSQVTITGTIDEVLMARSELVGYFPIELTFDISAENESATEIMELGRRAGVCITISHKERESGMSVTVKGSEKLIDTIYEVYRSIRHINSMFPYDKHMVNSLYLFGNGCQPEMDPEMDNYVENLVERSNITSEGYSSEQSPVKSSSDTQTTHEYQQNNNNWTIYDPAYNQSFGYVDQSVQYLPQSQIAYQPSYNFMQPSEIVQETIPTTNYGWIPTSYSDEGYLMSNYQVPPQAVVVEASEQMYYQPSSDWTICGELQGNGEVYNTSFQEARTYPDLLLHQLNIDQGSHQSSFETEPQSPTSVISSPLIVGSEENVAGRLICVGWGNVF